MTTFHILFGAAWLVVLAAVWALTLWWDRIELRRWEADQKRRRRAATDSLGCFYADLEQYPIRDRSKP